MSNCWGQCLGLNNGFELDSCKYCQPPTCENCNEELTRTEAAFYGNVCNECAKGRKHGDELEAV